MIIAALVACEPTDNIEFSDYTQQESSSTESDIPEVSEDNPENDNSGNTQPPVVHGEPPKAETNFSALPTSLTIEMVELQGGTFNKTAGLGLFSEGRKVTISSFAIGKYEVTQKIWKEVLQDCAYRVNRYTSCFTGDEKPMQKMTWYDAIYFCNRLSDRCGLEKVYTLSDVVCDIQNSRITSAKVSVDLTKNGYRLSTEAEWEWAARGGNPNAEEWSFIYSGSNESGVVASSTVNDVGSLKSNSLGIFDMSGNVEEWCFDGYQELSKGTFFNPTGADVNSTDSRVIKGGSFNSPTHYAVSYRRAMYKNVALANYLGFRLARTITPKK